MCNHILRVHTRPKAALHTTPDSYTTSIFFLSKFFTAGAEKGRFSFEWVDFVQRSPNVFALFYRFVE